MESTAISPEVERRIGALERDVAALKSRSNGVSVRPFRSPRTLPPREVGKLSEEDMREFLAMNRLEETFESVRELTEEIFAKVQTVEFMYDPEYPSEQFIVFVAEASGPTEELPALQSTWVERLLARGLDPSNVFRLSIAVV